MRKTLLVGGLALAVAGGVAANRPLLSTPDAGEGKLVPLALPQAATGPISANAILPQPPEELDSAPIAMLFDLYSGQTLYARDIDQRFLPASVTKVMTLYTAFDLMAQGKLSPDRMLTVSDAAWREWHSKGSRMFLAGGSQISVHNLLMGIANVSANDGCVVLAEGVAGSVDGWVELMNAEARKLGMTNSHFGTPMGWMDEGRTYYSARDLTRLAQAMLFRFPEHYHTYIGKPGMTWNGITQPNHDPTLGVIPGADGIKTGFTNEAGYNFLGSAERDGRRLIMVIAHMPDGRQRAKVSRALMEWGFSAWESRRIYPAGKILADAEVQMGESPSVGLMTSRAVSMTTPRGVTAPVTAKVRYNGPLRAPIVKGQEVATLEVRVGQQPPAEVPLVAADDVPRVASLAGRLRAGLGGILQ